LPNPQKLKSQPDQVDVQMDESLLRLVLFLAYGPFCLMLVVFGAGLVMKWAGKPDFLAWLIRGTSAQQPLPRKTSQH
jgi:hypothetical protein